MADRAKEYLVYAGLAAGAERVGLTYAWALAIAAIVLQTVRHMTDTWYGALHDEAARRPRPRRRRRPAGSASGSAPRHNRVQADTGSAVVLAEADRGLPDRRAVGADRGADRGSFNAAGQPRRRAGLGRCSRSRTRWRSRCAAGPLDAGAVLDTVDASLHRDDGPLAAVRWPRRGCRRRWRSAAVGATRRAGAVVAAGCSGLLATAAPGSCAGRCRGGAGCWSPGFRRGRRARRSAGLAGAGRAAGRGVPVGDRGRPGRRRPAAGGSSLLFVLDPAPLRPDRPVGEAGGTGRRHGGRGRCSAGTGARAAVAVAAVTRVSCLTLVRGSSTGW